MMDERCEAARVKTKTLLTCIGCALCIVSIGTGCADMAKLEGAMKDDPATVSTSINTVYGTAKLVRTNPATNQTVTVSPDGTVTIGAKP